jgi:phosphatidylglycerol lysyltransferase
VAALTNRDNRPVTKLKIAGRTSRHTAAMAVLSAALLLLALFVLRRSVGELSLADIRAALHAANSLALLGAFALTVASYMVLILYDALALRQLGKRVPPREIAATAFVAFTLSYNIGMVALSGAALRLRPYTAAGLGALEVAAVMAFGTLTFLLGAWALLGLTLLLEPASSATLLHLPADGLFVAGAVLLLGLAGYLLLSTHGPRQLQWRERSLRLPGLRMSLAQVAVGTVDLLLAAAALYVLLPAAAHIGVFTFMGLYVLAIGLGLASGVPGGLGVFETVIVLLVPGVPAGELVGALLLYRVIYFLLPLAVALIWLAFREIRSGRGWLASVVAAARWWLEWIGPQLLALAVFLTGAVLLLSGATPAIDQRIRFLSDIMPLPVLELSHLAGSAIGVALLILARGLYRRVDASWWMTLLLLAGGVVAQLLKGFDYEEASLLLLVMSALWVSRKRFNRRAPLFERRFSAVWFLGVAVVVATAIWLGLAAYRDVPYAQDLWWEFAFQSNAPRWLRASVTAILIVSGFALWQLAGRSSRLATTEASDEEMARAASCVARSRDTVANLALLGDKQLLFSAAGDAFIMFQRSGRSIVALGDPVGNPECFAALAWRFRELCDRNDAWPVFYEVSNERLPLYLDLGLSLTKLGEEARVPLAGFSLEGPRRAELRTASRKGQREGLEFMVLPADQIAPLLPQFESVSDQWLAAKSAAEKGFSVGRFEPEYIARFPCAVVRKQGEIVAFANLWPGADKSELSVDLMRYGAQAPKGVMDYLFIEIALYAKRENYAWFNLGMAPLSGLERHPLAPFWHKLGLLVHRYGESFYNFDGLRKYKEKFDPVWRPRYLASPGGLALPRVLLDVAALIAGGVREVVSK